MKQRVFFRALTLTTKRTTGYSLVELLVVLLLTSFMMTLLAGFFRTAVATRQNTGAQTEAQQGLRAIASLITQELRQAGACLPRDGTFVSLAGTNISLTDSLTIRIGLTSKTTGACVRAQTQSSAAIGATTLTVDSTTGFSNAKRVFVVGAGGAAVGEVYSITNVNGNTITITPALTAAKPVASALYPLDERIYQIQTISGRQVLTVRIDGGSAQPLVDGVTEFNVRHLGMPCTAQGTCTFLTLPTTDQEWRLVREITIGAKIAARKKDRQGQTVYSTAADEIRIKPRNLL